MQQEILFMPSHPRKFNVTPYSESLDKDTEYETVSRCSFRESERREDSINVKYQIGSFPSFLFPLDTRKKNACSPRDPHNVRTYLPRGTRNECTIAYECISMYVGRRTRVRT